MWAPMTTSALGSLPAGLYPHGTAAFSTVQQLAGAAILISAFTTAGILAFGAILGTVFVGKAQTGRNTPE
jgi:MFS transporter, DHA2 family, lincomycin resistance protein